MQEFLSLLDTQGVGYNGVMSTVDVIIPTYNEDVRLFRAVESALSQTYPVNKVFVIDDGSDVECLERIKKKFIAQPRVEILSLLHTGLPGHLRKIGVERSEAEWIAFLDADDYWDLEKTRLQIAHLQVAGTNFICSNAIKVDTKGGTRPILSPRALPQKFGRRHVIFDNRVVNSTALVRRETLLEVGSYASSSLVRGVEDFATWLRVLSLDKGSYIDKPLAYYAYSTESLSRRTDISKPHDALSDLLTWLVQYRNSQYTPDYLAISITVFLLKTRNILASIFRRSGKR